MGGLVAGQSLKRLGNSKQFAYIILLHGLPQARFFVDRLFQSDFEFIGNQLGNAVHHRQGHFKHPAHVSQSGSCLHGSVGNNLGHMFVAPITVAHIVDDLITPILTEIYVKVRHGHSFNI